MEAQDFYYSYDGLEGSKETYLHLHFYLSLSLCLVAALEEGLGQAQCHSIHHWNSMG